VESKFKSGLHLSKVNGELVPQLAKYVKSRPEAKNGVVVSLFPEPERDLQVEEWLLKLKVESEIKEFKNIQFTESVHTRLAELLSLLESDKNFKGKIEPKDAEKISLLKLWNSYLCHLKKLVDYFEDHGEDLCGIDQPDIFKVNLERIKLKGIFERQRMIQIQQMVCDHIENKERNLLELFEYRSDHETVGTIDNTRGNAQFHIAIPSVVENEILLDFGLQWQADSLKFFIEGKNGITEDFKDSRYKALKKWGEKLKNHVQSKSQIGKPRDGKFSSVSIMKPKVFGSIESFPETLVLGLKFLLENREEIVKELDGQVS
jgi:hypothetical protein